MTAPKKATAAKKAPAKKAAQPSSPPAVRAEEGLLSGQLAAFTYFDASRGAGGQDVTRVGVVVDVADGKARMAWLDDVSDPIKLDALERL